MTKTVEHTGSVGAYGAQVDRRPRVAFVTSVYDQKQVGGGTFVEYLRKAVSIGNLDIMFFSDDMATVEKSYERKVHVPNLLSRLPAGWLIRSLFYRRAVRQEDKKSPFDVVWHNNAITPSFDVLLGSGLPVVGMINDYNLIESSTPLATRSKFGLWRGLVRFLWRQIERIVARRVQLVVVNSRFMADITRDAYGLSGDSVQVLYKGVDLEQFSAPGLREWSDGPIRLLFVKNDFVRGGLLDLLEALRDFPRPFSLTIIGPSQHKTRLIWDRARKAGVHSYLCIRDHVPRVEMPLVFASHDVFCVPSRSEALGVAFMEALACGIPVVAGAVGGLPEVLDHGRAGWLVPPSDVEGLRQTLIEVMDNRQEVARRRQHGLEHVKMFSTEHMVTTFSLLARQAAYV